MKKYLLTLLGIWLLSGQVLAIEVPDLYSGVVPIAGYSVQLKRQTVALALSQVLIKVSGNPEVTQVAEIRPALAKASSLVQSYNYFKREQGGIEQLYLQVKFAPSEIKKLLSEAKQLVWGRDRPLTLVWLTTNAMGKAQVLHDVDQNLFSDYLQVAAGKRGLPYILPAADTDQAQVIAVTQQLNPEMLQQAARNYAANATLVGFVDAAADGSCRGQWSLLLNNELLDWDLQNSDCQQLVAAAIDNVANVMIARYAILDIDEGPLDLQLKVVNVDGLNQYVDVVNYLRGLNSVSDVDLLNINADDVELKIKCIGGVQAFTKELTLNHKLQLQMSDESPAENQVLNLRWTAN